MESIYKALNILKKYSISEDKQINKYVNYANTILNVKPKYDLEQIDKDIIKCIINPQKNFNITGYGDGQARRTIKGVKVKEIISALKIKENEEHERIYGLIISEYIEPVIPITSEIGQVSDAITEIGIESNSEEYTELLLVLYKCLWLVEKFEDVDLSLLQEGYESYIRILFCELDSYKESVDVILEEARKKTDDYNKKLVTSEKNINTINGKVKVIDKKIDKFNGNVVSILSILVAIFSVIGINIGTIPKIDNSLLINVAFINISLIFVIITMFWLIDIIVFNNRHRVIEKFLIGIVFILIVMFIVAVVSAHLTI